MTTTAIGGNIAGMNSNITVGEAEVEKPPRDDDQDYIIRGELSVFSRTRRRVFTVVANFAVRVCCPVRISESQPIVGETEILAGTI
jgi:hypothetical protein